MSLEGAQLLSPQEESAGGAQPSERRLDVATFGGGCFWCVEAVFEKVEGVHDVVSGYTGGRIPNPSYEQVCTGRTGHVEVCQIHFDPEVVSYAKLLEIFWKTHDPTTKNRQGNDKGPQYRSVVFYNSDQQREKAEYYKKKLDEAKIYRAPVVTDIEPLDVFYPAEEYHQDYFAKNPYQGYCQAVIVPKMQKFKELFADSLKRE
jgi:peptide-methionine (S)-S-oxide reductase